jgi:hypothetical protein
MFGMTHGISAPSGWFYTALDEIYENAPIPYFSLRPTEFRRLKNRESERDIPIHPEMIRLGFLNYIRELRNLGKELLFPEMLSPAGSMNFNNVFMKQIFSKLRANAFPDGTDWFIRNKGEKEKDVHSLRGSTSNLMLGKAAPELRQDILGHSGNSETRKTYDEPASLDLKRTALTSLTPITEHIKAHPLNLRPKEWARYGQPRGRPVNGGRGQLPTPVCQEKK